MATRSGTPARAKLRLRSVADRETAGLDCPSGLLAPSVGEEFLPASFP